LIAGGLVILGVLLSMFVAQGLLVVAGLGAFGPGILRELGWLKDQDEFQRQAAHRAGYHAYLIGGLAAVLAVSGLRWRAANQDGAEWIMLILVVLWMTWLFSGLLAYWGARKTASRVLFTFGAFWAVFVIASVIGESANAAEFLLGSLMGTIVVAPFLVLARMAGRWPRRRTGAVLLAVAALFLVMFVPPQVARGLNLPSMLVTDVLFLVPLIGSGIALLRDESTDDPDRDESNDEGAGAPWDARK
jgi:hypothetical protein